MTTEQSAPLLRIQIGNLSSAATEVQVRACFLPHGQVQFYERPLSEQTQRPGATAYLEMIPAEGTAAIKALHGTRLGDDVLSVMVATPLAAWASGAARGPGSPRPRRIVGADERP